MSVLSFHRFAGRTTKFTAQREYPHLEALLSGEEGRPHNDYRIIGQVTPPIIVLLGFVLSLAVGTDHGLGAMFMIAFSGVALAHGVGVLCHRLDGSIPKTKQRIRKLARQIWGKYSSFPHLFGGRPTLSENVGNLLNEAAGLYLRHPDPNVAFSPAQNRAIEALETAMAQLLDLAVFPTVEAQDREFDRGWAQPVLREMRELDQVLSRTFAHEPSKALETGPLARLHEAKMELLGLEAAAEELHQGNIT
jgi:hypothetical protein